MEPRWAQEEVEKARSRNFHAIEVRGRRVVEVLGEALGDLPGRDSCGTGQLHGDRARPLPLPLVRITRRERDAIRRLGEPGRCERVAERIVQLVANH